MQVCDNDKHHFNACTVSGEWGVVRGVLLDEVLLIVLSWCLIKW